jgi:hypothetical protein
MATNRWPHRTGPGYRPDRYNLRGAPAAGPPAPVGLTAPHPRQTLKNNVARQIKNRWPITRKNRASRGLIRAGNTCFRLSGLQALLHLPKFLQWILSHNNTEKGRVVFPCRSLTEIMARLSARMTVGCGESSEDEETLPQCPACAVKALAQCYWGHENLDSSGEPMPLCVSHPLIAAVHSIDDALRRNTPGVGVNDPQEDPEEMQTRLLTACLESVDHT